MGKQIGVHPRKETGVPSCIKILFFQRGDYYYYYYYYHHHHQQQQQPSKNFEVPVSFLEIEADFILFFFYLSIQQLD
jgi:hypothetical protein